MVQVTDLHPQFTFKWFNHHGLHPLQSHVGHTENTPTLGCENKAPSGSTIMAYIHFTDKKAISKTHPHQDVKYIASSKLITPQLL
jgi:hypothetical protein